MEGGNAEEAGSSWRVEEGLMKVGFLEWVLYKLFIEQE